MAKLAGTYAFYERGASSVGDPNVQPYPFHWSEAMAPYVVVGEITFTPDGIGDGFYWIRLGLFNGGLNPSPLHVTVTEMNEDCTGRFTYSMNLPGYVSPTIIEERFILIDNGREYRSLPTTIQDGVETLTWLGEGHRISKPSEPLDTCGPQTIRGTYVWSVDNINTRQFLYSNTALLFTNVSADGQSTGTMYEKLGPRENIEKEVWGTIAINPDCSYGLSLQVVVSGQLVTIGARGVYFNGGKNSYGLINDPNNGGIKYSFIEGIRISE